LRCREGGGGGGPLTNNKPPVKDWLVKPHTIKVLTLRKGRMAGHDSVGKAKRALKVGEKKIARKTFSGRESAEGALFQDWHTAIWGEATLKGKVIEQQLRKNEGVRQKGKKAWACRPKTSLNL